MFNLGYTTLEGLIRKTRPAEHNEHCTYRLTRGVGLCSCAVLTAISATYAHINDEVVKAQCGHPTVQAGTDGTCTLPKGHPGGCVDA